MENADSQNNGEPMSDRFEFENLLYKCWHIIDDIDTVINFTDSIELAAADKDKLQNMLVGINTVYDQRFNDMMNMFAELVRNRIILGNHRNQL